MQKMEKVSVSAVDKFVKENNGECIDFADGSLIDNVVYSFPFGTMFCFETFINTWTSAYTVLFFKNDHERGIHKAWNKFISLRNPV